MPRPANVPETVGDQVIEVVYCACEVEVTGVAPVTGAVIPVIANVVIVEAVAGKTAVTTPEPAEFVQEVEPATVKKFEGTPVNV